MSAVDIEVLAGILRAAAKAEIMPRFRRLDPAGVRQKSEAIDLVTDADEAAEAWIRQAVADRFPGAVFIGEESVAADPGLLGRLPGADTAIIIDPIDGTANYAAGMPLFGTMAAVVRNGETVAGILYDPLGDDFVLAETGAGAWHHLSDGNELRLKAADPVPLERMVGTASAGFLPKEVRGTVMGNLAKVRMVASYRCAAHEYRSLAGGHWHFTMFNKLLPWDHLAGTLIAQEAGCYAARFDGSAYKPEHSSGGLLLAPDRASWEQLRAEVFTV